MNHQDHITLIKRAVTKKDLVWADIGSGTGAFTLALADLIGIEGSIYTVDSDQEALQTQRTLFDEQYPNVRVTYINKDYRTKLYLPQLDGIVMANSLHFVEDHVGVVEHLLRYLKPGGKFVIVEYNSDTPNKWVPYPIAHKTFNQLAKVTGLSMPKLIGVVPSQFMSEIYCCMSTKHY